MRQVGQGSGWKWTVQEAGTILHRFPITGVR